MYATRSVTVLEAVAVLEGVNDVVHPVSLAFIIPAFSRRRRAAPPWM